MVRKRLENGWKTGMIGLDEVYRFSLGRRKISLVRRKYIGGARSVAIELSNRRKRELLWKGYARGVSRYNCSNYGS